METAERDLETHRKSLSTLLSNMKSVQSYAADALGRDSASPHPDRDKGPGGSDQTRTAGLASIATLLTDETLTSVDDPCVVAAGDCAAPSD